MKLLSDVHFWLPLIGFAMIIYMIVELIKAYRRGKQVQLRFEKDSSDIDKAEEIIREDYLTKDALFRILEDEHSSSELKERVKLELRSRGQRYYGQTTV